MLCNCIFSCNYSISIFRCDLELKLYEQKIFEIKLIAHLYPNINPPLPLPLRKKSTSGTGCLYLLSKTSSFVELFTPHLTPTGGQFRGGVGRRDG